MSFWKNNGLGIVLLSIFLLTLVGHAVSGHLHANEELLRHGEEPDSFVQYLSSGEFIETVFENWESEFLQMGVYVIFTVFLFQKGSSESKKIDGPNEVDEDPEKHRNDPNAPGPVRKGGFALTLYKNSLGLALIIMFLVSFILHGVGGAKEFNEEAELHGVSERITTLQYFGKARFWFESFQNWQSEFFSVAAIVILSIWLRQHGSPESKPVHAPHSETGSG